jgi:uncharacterized protein (TIGR00730 family)
MAARKPIQAFDNRRYLHSHEGRIIRVLAEFTEPEHRLNRYGIQDTIVFFGSAKLIPLKEAKRQLRAVKKKTRATAKERTQAEKNFEMAGYYEAARELSYRLSVWSKKNANSFAIASGGGPGIMEAANRGARQAKFPSIGLNIQLPFEQQPNPYISPQLNFEFHYFFIRKFWFLYHAKAIIIFPGGFGTLDEMMEALTLVQTKKVEKEMTIVLYGEKYWRKILNFQALIDAGVIEEQDLRIFTFCSSVDEAFMKVAGKLGTLLDKRKKTDNPRYKRLIVET